MRIAYLIPVFPKLSETFILNQITGLIDRGYEVDIFGFSLGDVETVHPDVHHYTLLGRMRHLPVPKNRLSRALKAGGHLLDARAWHPATLSALNPLRHGKSALNLEMLYATLSFLKEEPYDIIHCHFGNWGPVGLELIRRGATGGKLVTSVRGADITSNLRENPGMYDELVEAGDLFLPISDFFKQKLIDEGCDPAKITVLRDGIDVSRFEFRARCRAESEPTRLLFIGRLEAKKGIFFATRAVANAVQSGRKVVFDIIGDGALRGDLERLIAEQGIADAVNLHGAQPQDRVLAHLREAHVLIAPSVTAPNGDQEGIPNTVKEGMAVGLPVLSTLHSGIPELVEDGVSGFLVPEHDIAALTERLVYLSDHPECWAQMGRAGRTKIETEYDIEALNDELVSLYQQLVHPHTHEKDLFVPS